MIIKKIEWEQVKRLPQQYPKEFASFTQHKKPHIWLGAFLKNGEEDLPQYNSFHLLGVGKILFVSKYHARTCSDFVIPTFRRMGVSTSLTLEREKIAIENGCTKIDYLADVSLEYVIPQGYIRKEPRGSGYRYEKDLTPYLKTGKNNVS